MKIDIYDTEEFIKINKLKEVTSPILFQRGDIPHPDGLLSNEIFGVTTKSRKETFAYIDLHGYFFHPHVYKVIERMYRNIRLIINGDLYVSIDKDGYLVSDPEGETGITFLYENWEKIKWKYAEDNALSMRNERIDLLTNLSKNEIFTRYEIVLPPFYRDILTGVSGGETDSINNLYIRLLRFADVLHNDSTFDFRFDITRFNIQMTLVSIYNYFKKKLEKKNGLIRKYLMGKNVDYCTRVVITNPVFTGERPEDMFVDFAHAGIPMSHLCSLVYPFLVNYIKNFFEREIFDTKTSKLVYDPEEEKVIKTVEIDSPEAYFSDKYIKKMLDSFIKSPESRFDTIEVPIKGSKKKYYLAFSGKRMDGSNTAELAGIVSRPLTNTDLIFMACEEVVKNKHVIITRYPVLGEHGIFETGIRVKSISKTVPMMVNGQLYRWYPDIDLSTPKEKIAVLFSDAFQFANSYLAGIDGDYDGDQTTAKIAFTQEANEEIKNAILSKANFIDTSGKNNRKVGKECFQTFYAMTKDPENSQYSKVISAKDKLHLLTLKPEDLTFSTLIELLGTKSKKENGKVTIIPPRFHPADTFMLSPAEYSLVKEPIKTTVGRFIFNKIMVEGLHFENILPYQNIEMTAGQFGKFDATIASSLKDDVIDCQMMINYINTRDWLGFQLHSALTTSFSPGVLKVPEKTKELKKELLEKYKDEIEAGNTSVMNDIENQLVKSMVSELKGDYGLDLYTSGARGSFSNHLKNTLLTRGAIKNPNSGKYEIITNALMDGLEKKDISVHSNMIVSGAYPKSVF